MTWINFLHLYQPANSDLYNISEALDKCYRPLLNFWEKHPDYHCTINISGCLLLRLEELRELEWIKRLKRLVKSGQIEIVGSAAYHALLPLISEAETMLQIREQEEILKRFLGVTRLRGFFLPEMAYSPRVAKLVKSFGYEWLILDPVLTDEKFDNEILYVDQDSLLRVVFRSRELSNTYVPKTILDLLAKEKKIESTLITATDGELYGLRHKNQSELKTLLKRKSLCTKTISGYLGGVYQTKKIKIQAGSWESTRTEVNRGQAFALWQDQKNKIHRSLWELADMAQHVIAQYKHDSNYHWARWHLVRGLASCTFWWASGRDLSHNFSAPAWSPDEIERGVNELVRSIRSLHDKTSRSVKIKAEKMQIKIKRLIWEKHWRSYF